MQFFLTNLSVILVVLGAVPTRSSSEASDDGVANIIPLVLQDQQLADIIGVIELDVFVTILHYIEAVPQIRNFLAYIDEDYFPITAILHGIEYYLENRNSDKSKHEPDGIFDIIHHPKNLYDPFIEHSVVLY